MKDWWYPPRASVHAYELLQLICVWLQNVKPLWSVPPVELKHYLCLDGTAYLRTMLGNSRNIFKNKVNIWYDFKSLNSRSWTCEKDSTMFHLEVENSGNWVRVSVVPAGCKRWLCALKRSSWVLLSLVLSHLRSTTPALPLCPFLIRKDWVGQEAARCGTGLPAQTSWLLWLPFLPAVWTWTECTLSKLQIMPSGSTCHCLRGGRFHVDQDRLDRGAEGSFICCTKTKG